MEKGTFFDEAYFKELLAEIREIRLSERKFYQKITDIYTTSIDYDRESPTIIKLFKKSAKQDALCSNSSNSSEIVYNRADHTKEHMNLTHGNLQMVRH